MKSVEEEELLTVSINTIKRSDVISVTPKIEGRHLEMELDIGSAISVIPIRTYKKVQVGKDQEKAPSEKDSHSKN